MPVSGDYVCSNTDCLRNAAAATPGNAMSIALESMTSGYRRFASPASRPRDAGGDA